VCRSVWWLPALCEGWRTVSLLLLADSLSAAARSPLKQPTASLDQLNRLQRTSHQPVAQNSHSNKNKADISPTTDKAIHSTCATNAMIACRAQLIRNFYSVCVCVFIFTALPIMVPGDPLWPTACEAVLAPQPGCMFGEKYLASASSQTSNHPFIHSQQWLPYPCCFPRKFSYIAVRNVLIICLANQPRYFCPPISCNKSLHESTILTPGTYTVACYRKVNAPNRTPCVLIRDSSPY
jgi:hypothetical protein